MCNKMSFDSKKSANAQIKERDAAMRFRSKKFGKVSSHSGKLSSYYCYNCGKYHLTSVGKLKGNQLKARSKHLEKISTKIQ